MKASRKIDNWKKMENLLLDKIIDLPKWQGYGGGYNESARRPRRGKGPGPVYTLTIYLTLGDF
jgi:hypothetical protein